MVQRETASEVGMTERVFLVKTGCGLFACDSTGENWMLSAKDGMYRVEKVSERSYRQLSKFFATVSDIYKATDASEVFTDADEFRRALLIASGWRKKVCLLDGSWHFEARSISYSDAKHDEFQVIFDKAIDKACETYGLAREDILHG